MIILIFTFLHSSLAIMCYECGIENDAINVESSCHFPFEPFFTKIVSCEENVKSCTVSISGSYSKFSLPKQLFKLLQAFYFSLLRSKLYKDY